MIEKHMRKLSPTRLRFMLFGTMAVVLIVCSIGFWLFHGRMSEYAMQISIDNAEASTSSEDIEKLQKLETILEDNKVAVTRAENIVADSRHYQYQTQIMDDIDTYARESKVVVTGYIFNNENIPNSAGGKTPANNTTQSSTPKVPGLKTTSVSISIENPVNYKSLMTFLRAIELNLTKMEIKGISMVKAAEKNDVQVNPIGIEVYTR